MLVEKAIASEVRAHPIDPAPSWKSKISGCSVGKPKPPETLLLNCVIDRGAYEDPSIYGAIVTLAGSYAQLGRKEEARRYVDELLRLTPRYTLRALRKNPVFVHPELIDKLVESMRLAGLPE